VFVACGVFACMSGAAAAHGPVAPVATDYLARVSGLPAGLDAKVVDGYVRMWLSVPPTATVEVLDYRGAPYLRFSRSGVEVNHNSEMYYLNQTPVAWTPPRSLSRSTPPNWKLATSGHAYEWHDGRLQALAGIALSPGAGYVGRWRIPIVVNGRRAGIDGGLWHRNHPSIVWLWPIVVIFACALGAWRMGSIGIGGGVTRGLALAALLAIGVVAIGRALHGRPSVAVTQWLELAAVAAFIAWALARTLAGKAGFFVHFAIASVAIWEGFNVLPTLFHGYVLIDLPAFIARSATVVCLGCGASLMLTAFEHAERPKSQVVETA
jgi:hypothetical protein